MKFQIEDTGIEKRLTYTASTDEDKRKLLAHAQRLIDRERRNWRRDAERLARSILDASPTAIQVVKRDAGELLYVLGLYDRARAAGDGDAASWLGFKVGTWVECLQNRRQERHAARGRTTKAAASKGGKGKHRKAREKWPTYQPEVDDALQRNPRLSYEAACVNVARKSGVSLRTIKRHTKNPKNS